MKDIKMGGSESSGDHGPVGRHNHHNQKSMAARDASRRAREAHLESRQANMGDKQEVIKVPAKQPKPAAINFLEEKSSKNTEEAQRLVRLRSLANEQPKQPVDLLGGGGSTLLGSN